MQITSIQGPDTNLQPAISIRYYDGDVLEFDDADSAFDYVEDHIRHQTARIVQIHEEIETWKCQMRDAETLRAEYRAARLEIACDL